MLLGITEGIYIHLKFLLELVAERFQFLFPVFRKAGEFDVLDRAFQCSEPVSISFSGESMPIEISFLDISFPMFIMDVNFDMDFSFLVGGSVYRGQYSICYPGRMEGEGPCVSRSVPGSGSPAGVWENSVMWFQNRFGICPIRQRGFSRPSTAATS